MINKMILFLIVVCIIGISAQFMNDPEPATTILINPYTLTGVYWGQGLPADCGGGSDFSAGPLTANTTNFCTATTFFSDEFINTPNATDLWIRDNAEYRNISTSDDGSAVAIGACQTC